MRERRRGQVQSATPRAFAGLRARLIAAIAAGSGLVQACGGRAQDVSDEDAAALGLEPTGSRGDDSNPVRTGETSTPRRAMPAPREREAPPREGELCYSPTSLADEIPIGNFLNFLPADAIDANGCLTSESSSWLAGGACNYDPRPAVVRGDLCCHLLDASIPGCGRPFVVADGARTAPVCSDGGWTLGPALGAPHGLSPTLAREIGLEWLADARLEHASIAAFASFSLSLLAVGAPAELLAASQRAGLDEVEHARASFALASRFMGETLGPGPLSLAGLEMVADLEALTLRTWLDGCVEETLGALVAAAQREGACDAAVRASLDRIADDEARHAELAWSFVAWALRSGEPGVRRALVAARDRLEASGIGAGPTHDARCDAAATDAAKLAQRRALGRLSPAEVRSVRAEGWREVIRPALDALLGDGSVRAASIASRRASV